jgi:hypothetical protein
MDLQGVSAMMPNQAANERQNQSSAETDNSDGGWKYITVHEGDRVYTYLVIGKNMKVLIGETSEKKTDDKDKKAADGKNSADGGTDQANASTGNGVSGSADMLAVNGQYGGKGKGIKSDFLMDTSMLALTGYYQEKMRETIRQLIGHDSEGIAPVNAGEKTKK